MRKIKLFLSLLMVMLLSIGQMWATDYELMLTLDVTKGAPSGSTSTGLTDATLKSYLQGAAPATSDITAASKTGDVYKGKGSGGVGIPQECLKIGKASGAGSISFTIASTYDDVTKVEITGYGWKKTTAVSVNSSDTQTPATALTQVTFAYEISGSKTITISSATSAFCATEIKLYKTPGVPSQPSLSVSPTSIDFGTVEKGTSVTSEAVAVSFANLTGSVTYSGLSGAFSATGDITTTGDEITIAANTETVGEYEQTLTVSSAADELSKTVTVKMNVIEPFNGLQLTFPDYNDKEIGSYTQTWTATKGGQVWTLVNFNNNNNTWNLIKAGRNNNNTSIATITTKVENPVENVVVTINSVVAANVNSHKLYVADNKDFDNAIVIDGEPATIAAGDITYTIPAANRANDLYYMLEYDLAAGSSNGFLQISKLAYAYGTAAPQKQSAGIEYAEADKKQLVKLGESFIAPTLTNPNSLSVTYTSSNTDVAEVAGDGTLTIKAVGVAEITASSEETDTYKAGSAKYTIYVAEHAGTSEDPYSVADAKIVIDGIGTKADAYVSGKVSQVDSYNSTYKSITYWISDDGTTTNQLQVYSGLAGVVKDHFESKDDLNVGDDVTVKGTLKLHNNSVYEFDYNNTIVIYKTTAQLAWSASSYNASLEGENTFPTLTNTNDVTVTYSSSDPEKAEINETTGAITLKAVGTVTITATFAGNETYKANAVSYEMSIASSLVTLTYNVDGGEAIDPVNVNALPNPLPTTTKAGKNFGGWFTDPEKEVAAVPGAAISENTTLYAKWLDPYTVAEAKTVIDANPDGIANQYVAGIISQIDSYSETYHSITYWISADGTTTNQLQVYGGLIGNAATALGKETFTLMEDLKLGDQVVVKGTLKKYKSTYEFDKNNIIYSFNRPAPKYTVRLWNTTNWGETINAHVWNNNGNVTSWPGEATTFKAGWNEFEVEEGNSLLFCNADGTAQTVDIANVKADACYVLTGEADVSGHLEVALDTECAARFYVAGNTELTGEYWNAAGARLQNGSVTFTNVPAGDHQFKVTNGSWNWERGTAAFDSENSNVTNWGDNNVGFTTTSAKDITIAYDEANNKIAVTAVDYVEPTYKAIVVAYGDKYYAMTTTLDNKGFTPLEVTIDGEGNVVVNSAEERSSILWKFTEGNGTAMFQDAEDKYLAHTGTSTDLMLQAADTENPEVWTWDSENGCYYVAVTKDNKTTNRSFFYQENANKFKNYGIETNLGKNGYSGAPVFYAADKVLVSTTAKLRFFAPVAWGENVYAYSWGGSDNGDHQMTAVEEGSRWFQCEIEKDVQFLFYKGNDDWSVQTKDLEAINADKCFAWTPATDNGKIVTTEITSCEMSYYIAGDEVLTGVAEWGHKALAANNTVAFSEVAADTYHFKITNGSWDWNLGAAYLDETACQNVTIEETDDNGNVVFTIDNPSDITIAYNPATEKISVVATAVTPKEYYTKVTSTADLTAGYYLIVSEDNLLKEHVALNGELSTLDATNNVIDVEIVTGKGIEVTEATNAAAFFIDPEIGTIKSAKGQFIGLTGTNNALKQSGDIYAFENAFSFDEDGNAVIKCGSKKLCYNSAINQNRFRYFTNDQQAIQLYKKAEAAKASPELAFAQSEVQGLKGNVIASNLTNEHNVPVTYVSSATTYASVDEEGNVTLKKAGNVTIYAVTTGDETYRESYAKYTITINDFGSYTRPVTPDNYGTICLPKAGVMTGATLFEIADFANGMIYVDEVNGGAMEAGKPYIFQATSDQLNVAYTSNVEVAAGENNGLHGFYNLENENAQFNIPADEGNYILYQKQYWLVSGRPAYIANYRAYIRVSEINYVAPAPGRRRVAMNVNGEQTATGINELNAAEAPVKMIMDGQLYILRGEKLYDATGRLVK